MPPAWTAEGLQTGTGGSGAEAHGAGALGFERAAASRVDVDRHGGPSGGGRRYGPGRLEKPRAQRVLPAPSGQVRVALRRPGERGVAGAEAPALLALR